MSNYDWIGELIKIPKYSELNPKDTILVSLPQIKHLHAVMLATDRGSMTISPRISLPENNDLLFIARPSKLSKPKEEFIQLRLNKKGGDDGGKK